MTSQIEFTNWWKALESVIPNNRKTIISYFGINKNTIFQGNFDATCFNGKLVILSISLQKFKQIMETEHLSITIRLFKDALFIEENTFNKCNNISDVCKAYNNNKFAPNVFSIKQIYSFMKTNNSICKISQSDNEKCCTHDETGKYIGHESNTEYC